MKRVVVDMSLGLIHHGHIRILQQAKELGHVIVALSTDEEIKKHKGFTPELDFEQRKEILLALKYVDEVIPSPWRLDKPFMEQCNGDILVHSGDNANDVSAVVELERTKDIDSSEMRKRAIASLVERRNSEKCLLTPGPSNLHPSSLIDIRPVFSRNDTEYEAIRQQVMDRVLALAGQDEIVALQGSATTAIEVATSNFLTGRVLIITSGYYSQRLNEIIARKQHKIGLLQVATIPYDRFLQQGAAGRWDWLVTTYTETADAFLTDLREMRRLSNEAGAKLMIDATGSINLETDHELADVCMFSSCKGLGGLAGAGFITYNNNILNELNSSPKEFILDIFTYIERKTTGPVHAICSLDSLSGQFAEMQARVRESKKRFLEIFSQQLYRKSNQPALCTMIRCPKQVTLPNVISYQPRQAPPETQVICHLFDQYPSNRRIGEIYDSLRNNFALS